MTTEAIKTCIQAQAAPRKMSADSILLRYTAEPPVLSITLLAYACCHPSVHIPKKIADITEVDVVAVVAPIIAHIH
jgi:hypothetical protein